MSDRFPDGGGKPASTSFPDPGRPGPLDSDVAVGLLKRGQVLADQGDWDLAAGTFARVVGHDDPALHTAALLGLAECRYRLDEEPAALQAWISATQAPENELTWRAWKALAAARVRGNDIPAAARAYREAARRAPASEQPELQSRIGWLSKELGDDRGAQRAFSRTRANGTAQPIVTYAILGVTILVSLLVEFSADDTLMSWLRLDKGAIYLDGEYWRLLTVALVHGSIIHLLFNMYALWIIGPIVEALYGPWRFLGLYLICVAAGSAASFATSDVPAVGASGGVFGLFGVLLVADRVHKPALTRNARNLTMQIGMLIAINLAIGFAIPGIDNAAHIGGLVAGAALGFLLVPSGVTLGSFWSRPTSDPKSPTGSAPDPIARTRGLRWLLLATVVAAIVVVVVVSPVTYQPPLWWQLGRQPSASSETVRDAVRVSLGGATMATSVRWHFPLGSQWQVQDQGAPGARVRPPVPQGESPPGGHAVAEMESAIDGAARDGIVPTEPVAA